MVYDFIMEMCEIVDNKILCSLYVCFLQYIVDVNVNCFDKVMFMLFMILYKKNKNSSYYDVNIFFFLFFVYKFLNFYFFYFLIDYNFLNQYVIKYLILYYLNLNCIQIKCLYKF